MYKNRIQELRDNKEIKQSEIAKYLGLNNSHYGHAEREDEIMALKHLNKVCNYLDASLDYIFEFTNKEQYKNTKKEIDLIIAGERLKEFRKEKKLTQTDLAIVLNTTKTVICGYEKGRYLIATPFLYTICKKYKVSADYLVGKIDNPKYLNK